MNQPTDTDKAIAEQFEDILMRYGDYREEMRWSGNPVNMFDECVQEAMELIKTARLDELKTLLDIALHPRNIQPNWIAKITLTNRIKALQAGKEVTDNGK